MNSQKSLRWFTLMIFFSIVACATPAHKNTWYTGYDTESILVRVYNQDTYEMDGYLVDSKGLAQQVELQAKSRSVKKLFIEPIADASLLDQAIALHIGEKNNLQTFRINAIGTEEISSSQILVDRADAASFNALDLFSSDNIE